MRPEIFDELVRCAYVSIKKDTLKRDSILSCIKLAATGRLLAAGACHSDLQPWV